MIKSLRFFDRTALSTSKIPLPISEEEKIIFFCEDVYFRFKTKQTFEVIESSGGAFYLTNMRIVYVPINRRIFTTFHVPLTKLFLVESSKYLECLCENSYIGIIYLNFKYADSKMYFSEINKAINNVSMDIDPILLEDDLSSVPLYSEIDI